MAPETAREQTASLDLDETQLAQFAQLGYIVVPGLLSENLVSRLKPEVDWWVDSGMRARSIAAALDPEKHGVPPTVEVEMEAHGELVAYPPLMVLLSQLLGSAYVFHHLHTDRHGPQTPGKAWHHDFEQGPQTASGYLMVHALSYLDGLDEDCASLVVLPGSHREKAGKTARADIGTGELPGEVVVDRLPPGSVVILHSALFHARRAKPGRAGKPRYFTDTSYCQIGTLWQPVKPYWRHVLRRGRDLHLDRGRWPELFAERHFAEYVNPR